MSLEFPTDPRQALEVSLTALVLGELPSDQAEFLRRAMAQDPELARMHERLHQTIDLVRETEKTPVQQPATSPEPLRLSEVRRQELLQQFKTITPSEFAEQPRSSATRWLVVVGIAAVLMLLLGSMLLPALSRAKAKASRTLAFSPAIKEQDVSKYGADVVDALKPTQERLPAVSVMAPPATEVAVPPPKATIVLPSSDDGKKALDAVGQTKHFGAFAALESQAVALRGFYDDSPAIVVDKPQSSALGVDNFAARGTVAQGNLPAGQTMAGGAYVAQSAPLPDVSGGMAGFGGGRLGSTPSAGYGKTAAPAAVPATPPQSAAAPTELMRRRYGLAPEGGSTKQSMGRADSAFTYSDSSKPEVALKQEGLGPPLPTEKYSRWSGDAAGRLVLPDGNLSSTGNAKELRDRAWFNESQGKALAEAKSAAERQRPTTGGVLVEMFLKEAASPAKQAGDAIRLNKNTLANRYGVTADQYKAANKKTDGVSTEALGEVAQQQDSSKGISMRGQVATNRPSAVPVLGDVPLIGKAMKGEAVELFAKAEGEQVPELRFGTGVTAAPARGRSLMSADAGATTANSVSSARPESTALNMGYLNLPVSTNALFDPSANQPAPANRSPAVEAKLLDTRAAVAAGNEKVARLEQKVKQQQKDEPPPKPATPPPVPQPEVDTRENAFSTFSLNVSDVSFKTAAASLEKGTLPEPASIRSEEFINAFDYRDPEPAPGMPVGFTWDRARYPFAQNRDLLRFAIKTATQGRQAGQPLNIVLLVDNSGSMERADRVRIIREALKVLAAQLQPQDKLSVVTFARTAQLRVDGVPGNQAGQQLEEISGLTPQGGTNLEEAMNLAYQTALKHYLANGINRVVLLTDGAANLGDVEPENLKRKVEDHRKQGIALDCFGIGWEGYNDELLETLSRNGDGRYGFINTPEEAATEFAAQLAGALHVAASDVKVQVEFNPNRVTAWRQIGYAKHQLTKEQFRDNTVDAAEIAAAESGNALYVVEVNPRGEGSLGTVRVRYKVPGTTDYHEHEWPVPYTGSAAPLEQASPAMRLAATACGFSEWLSTNPYAAEVTTDALLRCLSGVPEVYGADARAKKLEWMIRQAGSLAGR